jgi:hypothetical protein
MWRVSCATAWSFAPFIIGLWPVALDAFLASANYEMSQRPNAHGERAAVSQRIKIEAQVAGFLRLVRTPQFAIATSYPVLVGSG